MMRMGSCLICCKEAEFLTYPDGERKYAGRDDVDCTECGGYSITDEHMDLHRKSGELPSHLSRHTFALHRTDAAQI